MTKPTDEQVERAAAALFPFVKAWNLPLNPENLDLMAYCVLEHLDTGDLDRIVADVQKAIEDDARLQTLMEVKIMHSAAISLVCLLLCWAVIALACAY